MQLEALTPNELKELTAKTEDKEALREIATHVGATFSGNTGVSTLKEKINEIIDVEIAALEAENDPDPEDENTSVDPVTAALLAQNAEVDLEEDVHVEQVRVKYTKAQMLEMDAAQVKDPILRRQVIRAQALRMLRVRITNLDPADASVPSTLVTCYSRYTGKVSKIIPHDADFYEHGYHVPKIIIDELKTRTYNMRKEVKSRGTTIGVKEYKTVTAKKFVIEELEPLSEAELKNLANSQQGRGAIDQSK